ncbi:MAG: aminotransferase class V-fold PLP-dependent enzyme [Negativicutes bacterium]|nr:aminotransferase class V-fold PLP-dependent enzyme [Negativicutes bacterium]
MSTRPGLEPRLLPEKLLQEIRSKFAYVEECPHAGRRIFLDTASGSLRLNALMEAAQQELFLPDNFARPTKGSAHAYTVKQKGEDDVRLFLGAKSGTIMPCKTATEGMFRVVRDAVRQFPGTNVVTTVLDHPCTFDSSRLAAETSGKEWRVAPLDRETGFIKKDAILDLVDKNTSLLTFIHGSNITGALMDAKEIVREARKIKEDLCVIVDGVQYAPHAPVDVEDIGADVYLFGCYKAYTRRGMAFAHLSERFSVIPHERLYGKKADEWALGSADQFDYASWSIVVDYICWLGSHYTPTKDRRGLLIAGLQAMEAHELALLERVMHGTENQSGLREMSHVRTYGLPDDSTSRSCLVAFSVDGLNTGDAVNRYVDQGVMLTDRKMDAYSKHMLDALGAAGIIRMSAAHYTTPAEIDEFLRLTEAMHS